MATYTFLATDLRSGAVLAELPLVNVSLVRQLNGAGTFKAQLPLGDPNVAKIDPDGSTLPNRTVVWVDRDGTLLGAGIIWTRKFTSDGGAFDLGGTGHFGYFARRRILDLLTFAATDQLAIAQSIFNYAQAAAGGYVGVNVGYETSGRLRDRTYNSWDVRIVSEVIQELSQVIDGFDFAIDTSYVAGVPTATLNLSYPRRGRTASMTGWVFEYPGNIQTYDWPEDGSKTANTVITQGSGMGAYTVSATASQPGQIDAGYPLLEDAVPYKQEPNLDVLAQYANAALNALAAPITLPTLVVRPDLDPVVGSYVEGDDIRVRITDTRRFPAPVGGGPGLDTFYRIIAMEIQPRTDSTPEQVVLTLGAL